MQNSEVIKNQSHIFHRSTVEMCNGLFVYKVNLVKDRLKFKKIKLAKIIIASRMR